MCESIHIIKNADRLLLATKWSGLKPSPGKSEHIFMMPCEENK